MKTLKNKITENRLREIINESVEDVLNRIGIINEMAVPLKTYKTRVDGLRFQLVENWCLCKWCQLFNPECENFAHWITELKACIDNLKFLDIKNGIDKRRTLTPVRDKIRTMRVVWCPQYDIPEWPQVCCRRNNMPQVQR